MVSFVPGGNPARLRLSAGRVVRTVHSFPSNLQTTLKTFSSVKTWPYNVRTMNAHSHVSLHFAVPSRGYVVVKNRSLVSTNCCIFRE
jgi:hypothetical protein